MDLLITGAAGLVGRAMRRELRPWFPRMRLLDVAPVSDPAPGDEVMQGSIADLSVVSAAMRGVRGVLHLAGCTTEAPIEAQVEGNVVGAWNVFEAARIAGVERVVFASSHHVVGYYPRRRRIGTEVLLRPDSRYGLTKAFGEGAGALFADKHGLRVLCVRIGFAGDAPVDRRRLSIWVSWRDLAQLVRIGLEHPSLRYAVVYGASDNARGFFDNRVAFDLGYTPKDRAEDYAAAVLAATEPEPEDEVGTIVMGGHFANLDHQGDPRRVLEW
ncbi:NAD-dependent epimerase/dehydratase family protein [Roseomonas sp. CCTCC AB2023176]|uniref:NAD-dependent epimerase/dehydratase family protein n=1 Tax=Roseomonas sp. CCTCC AB2023176 TaxID=3342640 RepID=UPI0035D88CCB